MSDQREQELEQQLNEAVVAVWERRRDQVMGRVGVLVRAAASLRDSAAPEVAPGVAPEVAARAKDEAHRLAGSLGCFGFDEGSSIAADIEELLSQAVRSPEWMDRLESNVMALKTYMDTK
jgi:HPt (histidine-containing phosphotransfer) domain-containing protein